MEERLVQVRNPHQPGPYVSRRLGRGLPPSAQRGAAAEHPRRSKLQPRSAGPAVHSRIRRCRLLPRTGDPELPGLRNARLVPQAPEFTYPVYLLYSQPLPCLATPGHRMPARRGCPWQRLVAALGSDDLKHPAHAHAGCARPMSRVQPRLRQVLQQAALQGGDQVGLGDDAEPVGPAPVPAGSAGPGWTAAGSARPHGPGCPHSAPGCSSARPP